MLGLSNNRIEDASGLREGGLPPCKCCPATTPAAPGGNRFRCPDPQQWYNRPPNPLLPNRSRRMPRASDYFSTCSPFLRLPPWLAWPFFPKRWGPTKSFISPALNIFFMGNIHWPFTSAPCATGSTFFSQLRYFYLGPE